jgi:hypothetical protein
MLAVEFIYVPVGGRRVLAGRLADAGFGVLKWQRHAEAAEPSGARRRAAGPCQRNGLHLRSTANSHRGLDALSARRAAMNNGSKRLCRRIKRHLSVPSIAFIRYLLNILMNVVALVCVSR